MIVFCRKIEDATISARDWLFVLNAAIPARDWLFVSTLDFICRMSEGHKKKKKKEKGVVESFEKGAVEL